MAKGIGVHGELFRALCDPAHLIRSARAASRGKRLRSHASAFLLDLEPECFRLAAELATGSWQPGGYRTFTIREPKPRLISAAPFRDRVVHHALVSLLQPHFERRFVAHSYACRPGKGSHRALLRASELMARRRFVLKGDVKRFFPSIDHELLKAEVRRVVADERLLGVMDQVIDGSNPQEPVQEWFPGDDLFAVADRRRGIPIGNLTSQFLANVFLDRFDHGVMDRQGWGEYVRYCDDFLVFGDDAAKLWALRDQASTLLEQQRLRLHESKGGVHRTTSPVPFLGFTLAGGTRRLQRAGLVRATRRLKACSALIAAAGDHQAREVAVSGATPRVAAWIGHARYATSRGLVPQVLRRAGLRLP
jgi:retron-type reverse transcriptase